MNTSVGVATRVLILLVQALGPSPYLMLIGEIAPLKWKREAVT